MNKKAILAYGVTFITLVSIVMVYIYVIPNRDEKGFHFVAKQNEVTIKGYSGIQKRVMIPAEIEGIPVKSIESNAFAFKGLLEVQIPDSVTRIATGAFNGNRFRDEDAFIYKRSGKGIDRGIVISYAGRSKKVVIPEQVINIAPMAFDECGIKEVIFPEGLKHIERYAFMTNRLTEVELPASLNHLGDGAFLENRITKIIAKNKIQYIGDNVFGGIGNKVSLKDDFIIE